MELNKIVNALAALDGVIAVAIVDYESGMVVAAASNQEAFDLEVVAASGTNILRAKQRTIALLQGDDVIHDIVISMSQQYHLICPCTLKDNFFIYLVVDTELGNLSICRRALFQAEKLV